jgi:hypothetical protein
MVFHDVRHHDRRPVVHRVLSSTDATEMIEQRLEPMTYLSWRIRKSPNLPMFERFLPPRCPPVF